MVMQFWEDREAAHPTDPVPFGIHEQDRQAIRDNIIEAVIGAPEPVRYTLTYNCFRMQAFSLKNFSCDNRLGCFFFFFFSEFN